MIGPLLAGLLVFTANAQPPIREHVQMLYPVVLVEARPGVGSGTVIYSKHRDETIQTYILTNHHVVDSAIKVEEEWSTSEKKDIKVETRKPVVVNWFRYNHYSRSVGRLGKAAEIVAYSESDDLALLKLVDGEEGADYVAQLMPENERLYLMEPAWAVGAGFGNPPFATQGLISLLDERIDGKRFILASALIIYGNSGGALYHWSEERNRYELIGVPARVSGAWGVGPVEHLGWSIPVQRVREFLRKEGYGFIVGDEEPDSGQ